MKQKKLLYKSMIKSQFNYCPLAWMFCSRQSNNITNKIHERFLRISYKDQKTSYHNLLETHNELTIHQRNLQVLMTEIYLKLITLFVAPPVMNSLFEFRTQLAQDVVTTLGFGCILFARSDNIFTTLSQRCVSDVVTTTKN